MKSAPFFKMEILCKEKEDFEIGVDTRPDCEPKDMLKALACSLAVLIEFLEKEYEIEEEDVVNMINMFNQVLEMRLVKGGKVC